jgi:hypothetical protein
MTDFPLSITRTSGILGVFLGIAIATIGSAPAAADPIKLTFTALITESTGPAEIAFGIPVQVGDTLSGTFTFDRVKTPDCSNCSFAFGAPYGMSIDGSDLMIDSTIIASWHGGFGFGEAYDFYGLLERGPYNPRDPFSHHTLITGDLHFRDPDAMETFPTGFPVDFAFLRDFPIRELEVIGTADNDRDHGHVTPYDFKFGGVITAVEWALEPAAVPEPGTLGLLCAAIGVGLASSRTIRDRIRRHL